MKKGVLIFISIFTIFFSINNSLAADINESIIQKTYKPTFFEWLSVYLPAKYNRDDDDFSVRCFSTPDEKIITNYKIHLYFFWRNTPRGKKLYNQYVDLNTKLLKLECELWNIKGYTIDFSNDVVIHIEEKK